MMGSLSSLAWGQGGNLDGIGHYGTSQAPRSAMTEPLVEAESTAGSEKKSLANLAPVLYPFFNNGPVYGLPGTISGDFWERTQLTGDWLGRRAELADRGLFFDLYTTSTYQNLTSGGIAPGDWYAQNTQLSLNLDTGRAGLWDGGLIHFTAQSRYGANPQTTFNAGTSVPVYTGLVEPDPMASSTLLPSEYFYLQALNERTSFLVGKISDVYIPDQTLFGDSYKFYFSNFALNKNPITTNFYNPTAWAMLGIWAPNEKLAFAGGLLDPNSKSQNLATRAYDGVNVYLTAVASYDLAGLPGQFSPAFNWSNQDQIDLRDPYGTLAPGQVPQAIGALLGLGPTTNLPVNYANSSLFLIANLSQYLYVVDSPATVAEKLRSGQPLRGIGVFGRGGWAPERTNTITADGSIALFARGLVEARPDDSFGVGWYVNGISSDFKNQITDLTDGARTVSNEQGLEIFYDYAVTPWIRVIPSYQHIWNPLSAQVVSGNNHCDLWMIRTTVVF